MSNTPHPKSTIATAVSMGLLGLALNSPALAQTTTAIGSSTVNAISSGSGAANANGTTTVNAATLSGSGTAASGTTAPVTGSAATNPAMTTPNPTTTGTTASGSTVVDANSSGSGNVNATGSTTVNAATVNGSGTAASGTAAPVTSGAASPATTAVPGGTGTTAPAATSSSTSTASATAINDIDLFIIGGTVSTTPPAGVDVTGNTATAAGTETQPSSSVLSGSNASSLQQGLRNGTTVTLTGAGETATFTPPTGHMGNGETRRAVTIATRDLAAAGISDPTPTQLQAALMGGTVTNAQGQVTTMEGVLQQRSQGMGWGNIAKANGVHPSQSGQGADHSRRFGNHGKDGADGRHERSHALSRESGRNGIAQDRRTDPARSIGSADRDHHAGHRTAAARGQDRGSANSMVASVEGRGNDHRSMNALRAADAAGAQNLSRGTSAGPGTRDRVAGKDKSGPGSASGPDRNAGSRETGREIGGAGGNGRGLGGLKGGK